MPVAIDDWSSTWKNTLLSIIDLIAQGQITNNFVEPSFDLVQTWNDYYFRKLDKAKTVLEKQEIWSKIRDLEGAQELAQRVCESSGNCSMVTQVAFQAN